MRLIILGPPGAGKGTQADRIAAALNIPAISTGEIFRSNIREQTELGVQVQQIIASGAYVPDELTNAIVRSRLMQPDARSGFLLDGYPRTVAQVQALDDALAQDGHELDGVLELTVDVDEVVRRLLRRAQIEGRVDDTEEVVRRRLDVYAEQTAPLTEVYAERGLLRQVDGMGPVDVVTERLQASLRSASADPAGR